MATLTVNASYGFDMRDIDFGWLPYADSYSYGSTIFAAHFSDGVVEEFRGSGFTYDSYGVPTGGTVRSYALYDNGTRVAYTDGIRIAVTSIVYAAETYTITDDVAVIKRALAGDDVLKGGGIYDYLRGFAGNDTLYGNGGNDALLGEDGNDILVGGTGADKLYGGNGTDSASYSGAGSAVTANLANSSANTNDARGDVYTDIENLIGSGYSDRLYGNTGANSLVGGRGNDVISGNSGSDLIYGGIGADRTYGGSGADRFVFKAPGESAGSSFDSIFDYAPSSGDRIDLSAIDASTKLSGNQAFSFVGTAAFKGVAGELRYDKEGSDTFIYADVNGDKKADLTIHLDDAVTLTKGYFLL
ncbi:calcium-binding protein [Sinorhizobium meliloti]|uniref:calcium-binding protein n=1 Tax=Rhizobium meliloti TaxID=382 RepID=UPI0013E2D270|nr:calcium-binding protein [Sinorhizobium meliloti]